MPIKLLIELLLRRNLNNIDLDMNAGEQNQKFHTGPIGEKNSATAPITPIPTTAPIKNCAGSGKIDVIAATHKNSS
jgi:hypothetical protein